MSLAPGTRLGPYEINAKIGAGGMGEVWSATDTNLGRRIAIKVLPEAFVSDADRLTRFEREAKTLASLNHPNIAGIYGLEKTDRVRALVMELVEGPTLDDRIARGPVPVDEALPIAKQIAEALEAAHEQGIVHRDLKPPNIKVRDDGTVKVLDFGLAKLVESGSETRDPGAAVHETESPTITSPAVVTGIGVLLGTAAYMSPEQARGRRVDKRCDIWAFGCVLYEMLSGCRPFGGADIADVVAAVIRAEPDWSRLPSATPLSVRTLLRRCLEKDPRLRLRDAGDARLELDDALTSRNSRNAPLLAPARTPLQIASAIIIIVVALAGGAIIGAWWRHTVSPGEAPPLVRLNLSLPPGSELAELTTLALSPDGAQLAYVALRAGVQQLHLRPLGSLDTKALPGTEGAMSPFFSPDGKWLGFTAGAKLKKVSTSGGLPIELADTSGSLAGGSSGGAWGPNDTIVFRGPAGTGLLEIAASGGAPRTVVAWNSADIQGSRLPQHPEFLPGGKALVFTSSTAETVFADEKLIEVMDLSTGARKTLIRGGSHGRYLPTGHLVFLRSGTLMAVPFDLERLAVTGAPVPVLEGVRESVTGVGLYSCSLVGTCVYASGGLEGSQRRVGLVDRAGHFQTLALPPQSYGHPRFSPSGNKIAFWIERSRCDALVYDMARGTSTLLTLQGDSHFPTWTPDGKRITYIATRPNLPAYELFWKSADGSGAEEKLVPGTHGLASITPLAWSPDGETLAYVDRGDIWLMPTAAEPKPRPFFESRSSETMPAFSPDGRWLAYVSDESGRQEIYVQPFPGPGGKYIVSTDGGTEPAWGRNGRELYFRSGTQVLVADVGGGSEFTASNPRLLFVGQFVRRTGRISYDVSPDGQRFVVLQDGDPGVSATQINVVQNWFEELKRLVPTS